MMMNMVEENVKTVTRLCKDLEANDPSMTTIDLKDNDLRGYGYAFGSALLNANNAYIRSIENLSVDTFLYHHHDDDVTDIEMNSIGRQSVNIAEPFVKFLRESKSMRRIHLVKKPYVDDVSNERIESMDEETDALLQQILEAVAYNKLIEDVDLDIKEIFVVRPEIVTGFLGCNHIKYFGIPIWNYAQEEDFDLVLDAFRSNQTIETLTLHFDVSEADDHVAAVLSVLSEQKQQCKIRVLALDAASQELIDNDNTNNDLMRFTLFEHSPVMTALASFVGRTTTTTTLEHLCLQRFCFRLELLTLLLDNLTVPKLTLTCCKPDAASFVKLASYVQASSSLQEIELAINMNHICSMATDGYPGYRDLLMGSSLQVLNLSSAYNVDVDGLFLTLRAYPESIRLLCLHLPPMHQPNEWLQLSRHLPYLINVQVLQLGSLPTGTEVMLFRGSMKQNGSLRHVFLETSTNSDNGVCLGKSERFTVLGSVCKRNRMLRPILRHYERLNDQSDTTTRSHRLSLFPLLLQSASKIQQTGQNLIFIGLLSINISIGSDHDGKRSTTSM